MQLTHVVKSLIIKYLNWVYFGYIHLWGLVMLVRRTSLRFSSQFESRSDKLPEWVPVGKLVKCAGVTVWYSTVGVPLCRFNCAKAGEGEAWICVCVCVRVHYTVMQSGCVGTCAFSSFQCRFIESSNVMGKAHLYSRRRIGCAWCRCRFMWKWICSSVWKKKKITFSWTTLQQGFFFFLTKMILNIAVWL